MTRKRVRESIGRILHEDCPYCDGKGFVKTATTVAYEIFGEIRREAPGYKDPTLVINCNAEVARLLQGEERQELRHLMDRYNKSIQVKAQQNYHREQYDIYGRSAQGGDHKVASSPGSGDGELSMQRRPESGGGERGFREGGGGRDRDRGERGDRGGGRDRDRGDRGGGRDRERSGDRDRERSGDRDRGGGRDRDRGGGRDRDRNRGEQQRRPEQREGRGQQQAPAGEQPAASSTPPGSSGSGNGGNNESGGNS
jgi:ribonuclease G